MAASPLTWVEAADLLGRLWLPTAQRQPELRGLIPGRRESVRVLLYVPGDERAVAGRLVDDDLGRWWLGDDGREWTLQQISHWMPLPPRPAASWTQS